MALTLVPSRKVRRRAAFTLAPLAAIAVAAGCGGGGDSSTGSSAGTTADFVPASAPFYVEVDSDTQSALAVGDRYGDMAAEDLKLPLHLRAESAEELPVFRSGP